MPHIFAVAAPYRRVVAIGCVAALCLGTPFTCITLPMAVMAITVAFANWNPAISVDCSQWLRRASILLYVLHGNIEKIFRVYIQFEHGPMLYLIILSICLTLAAAIISLSRHPKFHWLRHAY